MLRDLVKLNALVTVVARSTESKHNAMACGINRIFDSIEIAAQQDSTFQGIVVVTPLTTHFEILKSLIALFPKVPIFCEKELVMTVDEAESLQRIADAAGSKIFTMHKWRYHNGILKLKELLASPPYGKLRGIKLQRLGWGSSQKDVDTIMTAMPHDLSIVLELLGKLPEKFYSIKEVESSWRFSQTVIAEGPPFISMEVSSHAPRVCRSVQLYFERATALLEDSYDEAIKVYSYGNLQEKNPPPPEILSFVPNMPLETELENFLQLVKGEKAEIKSGFDDSIKIIRALQNISMQ